MSSHVVTRRLFIRVLAGMFAFVPATRSLTAFAQGDDRPPPPPMPAMSKKELEEEVKARIAEGTVLILQGESILIKDRFTDKLRLIVTDQSIVRKGKANTGKDFQSYPHPIDPGDDVIALGRRSGTDFTVEKMYVNNVNAYVTVDGIRLEGDDVVISYADGSTKSGVLAPRGIVRVRSDYVIHPSVHQEVVNKREKLQGTRVQVIGYRLKDGTIAASNVLF